MSDDDFSSDESWLRDVFKTVRAEVHNVADHFIDPIMDRVRNSATSTRTEHPKLDGIAYGILTELINLFSSTVVWVEKDPDEENDE